MALKVDLNCDLGESFGLFKVGADSEVLRLVSSANIACGLHAGDFHVMHETVKIAISNHVSLGAHPGLPDLQGFGRRWVSYTPQEIYDLVLYQIGALAAFVHIEGGKLAHVKPHGALYNKAAVDHSIAAAIAQAVRDFDPNLRLFALSGSCLIEAGREVGLQTVSEVFADRNYMPDGTLVPRSHPQAMVHSLDTMGKRLIQMVKDKSVVCVNEEIIPLEAETICLHGDDPEALAHAQILKKTLEDQGIIIQAF